MNLMRLTETVDDLTQDLNRKANKRLPGKQTCPYPLPRLGRLCFTRAWGHTSCAHSKIDHTVNIWNSCKSLTLKILFYSILPAVLKLIWHHLCTPAALVPTGLSFPRDTHTLSAEAIWRKKGEKPPPAQRETKLVIKLVLLQAGGKAHLQIMVAGFCRDLC